MEDEKMASVTLSIDLAIAEKVFGRQLQPRDRNREIAKAISSRMFGSPQEFAELDRFSDEWSIDRMGQNWRLKFSPNGRSADLTHRYGNFTVIQIEGRKISALQEVAQAIAEGISYLTVSTGNAVNPTKG